MFAATQSTAELLKLLGIVIVVACLCGAAYMAYLRNALAAILLLAVAIVAAFLLL